MGVKSTRDLTRAQAEDLYVSFKQDAALRKIRAEAVAMDNKELEDVLEQLNDEKSRSLHGGSGFDNYSISG